jgi:hypothetical protein
MDYAELRDLLLYLGAGNIADKDLPHRTKVTDLVRQRFHVEYKKMVADLKVRRNMFTSHIYLKDWEARAWPQIIYD